MSLKNKEHNMSLKNQQLIQIYQFQQSTPFQHDEQHFANRYKTGCILNLWVSLQSQNSWVYTKFMGYHYNLEILSKNTLYFGSVARTREKKTNIAAVIVQKRKENRTKIH